MFHVGNNNLAWKNKRKGRPLTSYHLRAKTGPINVTTMKMKGFEECQDTWIEAMVPGIEMIKAHKESFCETKKVKNFLFVL